MQQHMLHTCWHQNFMLFLAHLARTLLWQVEDILNLLHLCIGHTIGLRTHGTGTHVDICCLTEHISLIESIHDVCTNSNSTMLLPHHDIMGLDLLECSLSKIY